MAYIGRGINNLSNAQILDTITFTNSAGPYDLEQGSAAFTPISPQALVISVDGVIQSPDSYTISAATITFGVSMASTLTNDFIVHNGVGLITEPSDGSVTAAKLATDAVETAKIKDLNVTAGKLAATQDLSTKTITLPASVSGLGTGITNSQLAGSIDVTTKITGVVPTANLGSGSASSSTYLAGDQTYKTIVATDIAWQAVTTGTTLTAVAGRGYPIDTTSNVCTVTLPVSASVGDQIIFTDYARTWATYAVTLDQGSLKYQGNTTPNAVYDTAGQSVHIVYMDATQGWIPISDDDVTYETPPPYDVEFLVVAGGGGGGHGYTGGYYAAGGGGGGYLNSYAAEKSGKDSATLPVESLTGGDTYTVTVGTGGAGGASNGLNATIGVNSSIIGTGVSLTATGGGYGRGGGDTSGSFGANGGDGGCGGGSADGTNYTTSAGGSGTALQGFDGGGPSTGNSAAGGGGTGAVGSPYTSGYAIPGGVGQASSITTGAVTRAAGGTGANNSSPSAPTANSGNGGAGTISNSYTPTAGATGVVILRMLDSDYSGTTSGSPTVATGQGGSANETILTFNASGSYTA